MDNIWIIYGGWILPRPRYVIGLVGSEEEVRAAEDRQVRKAGGQGRHSAGDSTWRSSTVRMSVYVESVYRWSKKPELLGAGFGSSRDLCRACGGPKDFEDDFVCWTNAYKWTECSDARLQDSRHGHYDHAAFGCFEKTIFWIYLGTICSFYIGIPDTVYRYRTPAAFLLGIYCWLFEYSPGDWDMHKHTDGWIHGWINQ